MADFDLFDLVKLAFDPPETKAATVKKKMEEKIGELGEALGRSSQQIERDQILAQIDFLKRTAATILSPDGKKLNDAAFKALASQKAAAELSALAATVELLALTGVHTITRATIRHYKNETHLSEEHVKKAFTDAGFEVVNGNAPTAYPKFPTNADRIYSELAALRRTKDPNPNGADTSVVVDLYAFAAYISNDIESLALYRAMSTQELREIFDRASRVFSQRNDDLGKLCGSLSTAAKTYVFNSDENRAAYDQHLIYHCEALTKLFATMKMVPETTLRNPMFAEGCIKQICEYFPDYDVALAIYNREAELDPPYVPMEGKYTIKCNNCGIVNEFESEASAIKANACRNCRKPLFKICGKCKKPLPAFKNSCPHCGYVFASAALFAKYFQQAEAALRRSDFEAARKYLFQAQSAAPGEKARIDQLSGQIDQQEATFKKPINRLRQLIAERRFHTARQELGAIIRQFPNLNVSQFSQTITEELSRVDKLFASASQYTASRKADVCIAILLQCVDYQPALSFLQATAPLPCGKITATPVANAGAINISWGHSSEQGVTYRLVRKAGNAGSASESDGEILADRATTTSFTDEHVKPGTAYTYSVFTIRQDVYSSPVSKTATLYCEVKNCRVTQRGSGVRITWDAPYNSRGATVKRTCDGRTVTLTESAHGSYEDTATQYGKTYVYRVLANYDGNNRSSGVESVITPLPSIQSYSIHATQIRDNLYQVSWNIKQRGIDLRIMINDKLSAEAKSEDGAAQVSLPPQSFCKITVLAYSGGQWMSSDNSVEVNTFSTCAIDRKATSLEETTISGRSGVSFRIDLKIRLAGNIPSSVSGFYYSVRTSKAENRWASLDEIGKAADIQRIPVAAFQKQKCIPFQGVVVNDTSFFISVFTCYHVGDKEIISEPQRMKIDRPMNANLFWGVSYGMFDGLKLTIELSGNRPVEYVPELLLCVCDADLFITSQDDRNAQLILRIPSVELEPSVCVYRKTYPVKTDLPARYLKKCRYFLFGQDISSGDNITLRWKQGFSGKV